ncbi:uncharacterized protein LOC123012951 [Tribolium madens]|uniref:uncharacterized protein LOC123012951 n=1 Tax=Tribolium madens TaxID=41895 RepID=UPI001CF75F7A|nr:uncharacterized protein LOC123012951 [Tribolium madens]
MSVENKDESLVVPVTRIKSSALQAPQFRSVKDRAHSWLVAGKPILGKEMDSVFFNDDRFELIVDTRGFKPEDVKCTVSPNAIEIIASKQEIQAGTQRSMSTTRSYQLPQFIQPRRALCCFSREGILLVAVPWQR